MGNEILIAKGQTPLALPLSIANRHGLITGATGTGKTATLRVLAEGFSAAGVPVFVADVKGDLSGLSTPATIDEPLRQRIERLGIRDYTPCAYPVTFWDVFGERGAPIRTTISEMGPLLLSRLLGLNETQSGVLSLLFKVADDRGLLILDIKDLRAMLSEIGQQAKSLSLEYGNVSAASVGAIQRSLLALEEQGADELFGEPSLRLQDLLQRDERGYGNINILAAERLLQSPKLYSTLLLFLLAELFEELPEVGDLDRPRLVFFFDEAHLLFDEASKAVQEKVEQVVRLIRSKGVGIYFVTQSPLDIPPSVLGQLGNRVQHALRAFTPADQKVIETVAETFRTDSSFDVTSALTQLEVGEALISLLDTKGSPTPVQRAFVYPPRSSMTPISEEARHLLLGASPLHVYYKQITDRPSAYEMLKERSTAPLEGSEAPVKKRRLVGQVERVPTRRSDSPIEAMIKSAARAVGSQAGRQLIRGILGQLSRH